MHCNINLPGMFLEPIQTSTLKLFQKIVNGYKALNYFDEKLHLRFVTSYIRLCLHIRVIVNIFVNIYL